MMFAVPAEPYEIDPDFTAALNMLLIVHADHEQNCSTSTVRMVGSSDANLFASIAAGICALCGDPCTAVRTKRWSTCWKRSLRMVATSKNMSTWPRIPNDSFRLMGFGHRVYKNYDPRALIIKAACDKLLDKLEVKDPLFEVAQQLEAVAVNDPYFAERRLYPNVDFYSGVIYRAIGIPIQMFTVLFAMGRLPGWIAHWLEMQSRPGRICRPRQLYTGPNHREFKPLADR